MTFQRNPESRYRMPVVFGPAPGPRQKPDGTMWTAEESGRMNADWMAVQYLTVADKLEALLPPGFSLRGEPVVTVSCAWFKNLYWLAGRGYGILSMDFPVTYRGKTEVLDGSLCPVIWEGTPDAVLTGRDELGFPKMFADIPEIERNEERATATCSASWLGFRFFDIALTELVYSGTEPGIPGIKGGAAMYYKYVPRTSIGGREGPDAAYVTTSAPPPSDLPASAIKTAPFEGYEFHRWSAKGQIAWHQALFEQLPTSFHIVNGVANLDVLEMRSAELVSFSGPGIGIALPNMRAVEPLIAG